MLARESLAIGEEVGAAMIAGARRGVREGELPDLRHDLQRDAGATGRGVELLRDPLDVMVVIGGFNSSNTTLARGALLRECPHLSRRGRRGDRPSNGNDSPSSARDRRSRSRCRTGCPTEGPVRIGVTAGASTPNNKIGDAVARIFATRGIGADDIN